jgi:transcription initiation factor TFIID subunit 2
VIHETSAAADGLIIEQESSTEVRQADLARRQTVTGALAALKAEVANDQVLKECLWAACNSPIIGALELSEFADLCRVIYDPITTKKIALKFPRYWGVKHLGKVRKNISTPNNLSNATSFQGKILTEFSGPPALLPHRENPHIPPPCQGLILCKTQTRRSRGPVSPRAPNYI